MAEFSAHRASAASDTDVPWTSIAVMIRRGPTFDSGSSIEQSRGSLSLLFVLFVGIPGLSVEPEPEVRRTSSIVTWGSISAPSPSQPVDSSDTRLLGLLCAVTLQY